MSYGSVIHFRYGTEKNEEHNMCNKYFQKWRKNMGNCKKYWDKLTENLKRLHLKENLRNSAINHFKKKGLKKGLIIELCYVVLRNLQVAHKSMPS